MNKAKAIAATAFSDRDKKTGDQRRQAFEEMQEQINALGLSDAERRQLWDQRREEFQRREDEQMNKYVAMSPTERTAFMRQQVAEMAKRFDERAAKDKNRSSSSSTSGQQDGSGSGSGGSGGRGGNGGQNGGWRGSNNTTGESAADRRTDRRKQRLDQSTPLQRAQQTLYRQDLARAIGEQNAVRTQQGLPAIPLPGMGGRGGRGFGR
jgi:hypothetical protein